VRAVVLGGGIAGVFTAYFLRRLGFRVVGIGGRLQYPLARLVLTLSMPYEDDVELARRSLEIYSELAEVEGVTSVDILPEGVDLSRLRIPHEVVDTVEGVRLRPGEIAVISRDYLVPVRRVVAELRRELGFIKAHGRLKVVGDAAHVIVNGGRVAGDIVVLAAGHMNRQLAQEAGINLPLVPYDCYAVICLARRRLWNYSIGDYVLGWYGRPAVPPLYIIGNGCGRYCGGVPRGYASRLARLVSQRVGRVIPLAVRAGHCEVGPHGGPLYGKHPHVKNLYVIGGLDGYGGMVGPALAERLAALISGRGFDDAYRLERYADAAAFDPCSIVERHDWRLALKTQYLNTQDAGPRVKKARENGTGFLSRPPDVY
jgi:glycine/D-amino acid oxidase-like deaminating enzyme